MPVSNFVQDSFLGGEWSPFAQGKIKDPSYTRGMNVCRNGYPLEEGAWVRRSGTHFSATTYKGKAGRVIPFSFQEDAPYVMEFTDGVLRMFAATDTTSGLLNTLPHDFRIVTTNDNQQVSSVSSASPAVVATAGNHGWMTGDQGMFLFDSSVNAGFTPLLRNRLFTITVLSATTFSIADGITGEAIDGSTLGWSAPAANTVIFARALAITTPYTAGAWTALRKVQAETETLLLHGSVKPRSLSVSSLPTASTFASFSLATVSFKDGPYLDAPKGGTVLSPSVTAATLGTLPSAAGWAAVAWNGTVFCAIGNGTAAATSADGVTWVARTLPTSADWQAIAWNGSVFCAIALDTSNAGTTVAATSADGITWVARTLSTSGSWYSIAWDGTVFCVVGVALSGSATVVMTSPDGIAWTTHSGALPNDPIIGVSGFWTAVGTDGAGKLCALSKATWIDLGGPVQVTASIMATSSDNGTTWTQRSFPINSFTSTAIGWNGSVFCALGSGNQAVTSPDGVTWTIRALPSSQSWTAIAKNGAGLFTAVSLGSVSATSPDGITWTQRAMPLSASWDSIACDGTNFVAVASGSTMAAVSATGSFSIVSIVASSIVSINNDRGFVSTDVGRLIRLFSEPLPYVAATTYAAGNTVSFNGAFYVSLVGTNSGNQPDVFPSKWGLSTAVAVWTWGTISIVTSTSKIGVALSGPDLLYTTQINTWRLGVYSDTTGYPTNGVYYEGRIWLAGAVSNRVDSSVVNGITPTQLDMTPTAEDGTVSDSNGISYTFNSDDVNPIFWMKGMNSGIVCGTQAAEWLISAPTTGPITPTNIQAHRGTTYGSANMEPADTQLTISFVQRLNRTMLEYFPDVFSGRFVAPNLTETGKHLTKSGISEVRYQQELLPIIWSRMEDGSLAGATYERENLFSSQPPKFIAWHRHDLGSSRTIESIAIGPSADGTLDTLTMVTNDPTTGIRHIEHTESIFNVGNAITSGWFCDNAVAPSGGVLTVAGANSTITFYSKHRSEEHTSEL